jgi:hypothetical protein
MYRSRTAHRRWEPALHPSIVYSTGLWRISRTEEGVDVERRVVVEMQVVVEEGFDVVRSGAVGPLDADAIMFSDPYGELADDTGAGGSPQSRATAPSSRRGATGRAWGRLARPPNSRAKPFLAPFCPARKMAAETHCPKVRDEIARSIPILDTILVL